MMPFTEEMIWAVSAVLFFMLLDMVSGIAAAFKNNEYSSKKVREGIFHKAGLIVVVLCAAAIELFVLHVPSIGISVPLLVPVCAIIALMEMSSIMENAVKMNPALEGNKVLGLFSPKE